MQSPARVRYSPRSISAWPVGSFAAAAETSGSGAGLDRKIATPTAMITTTARRMRTNLLMAWPSQRFGFGFDAGLRALPAVRQHRQQGRCQWRHHRHAGLVVAVALQLVAVDGQA